MVSPSTQKHIHAKDFEKAREALNVVHHMKRTNEDLHVPAVLWAYRIMRRTLTMEAHPKLKYEEDAIIHMEHAKPSPRIVVPVDTMVREAWKEGIT